MLSQYWCQVKGSLSAVTSQFVYSRTCFVYYHFVYSSFIYCCFVHSTFYFYQLLFAALLLNFDWPRFCRPLLKWFLQETSTDVIWCTNTTIKVFAFLEALIYGTWSNITWYTVEYKNCSVQWKTNIECQLVTTEEQGLCCKEGSSIPWTNVAGRAKPTGDVLTGMHSFPLSYFELSCINMWCFEFSSTWQ